MKLNCSMKYSISTQLGEECGFFLGDDLEAMKRTIEKIGHEIKKIQETKREIENLNSNNLEINNQWRTT